MNNASSIVRSDILKAINQLDKEGVPKKNRSTDYDLHYDGRTYPPKHILRLAFQFAIGSEMHGIRAGSPTHTLLKARGFNDIRTKTGTRLSPEAQDEDAEAVYPEGGRAYVRHLKLERNHKLSKMVKNRRLAESGDLCCEVCGFSFYKCYGEIGYCFIEAHHTIPISKFKYQRITRPEEIALVCSNCHQMLHRGASLLSIEELRSILPKRVE